MSKKLIVAITVVFMIICGNADIDAIQADQLQVFGVFATSIEDPWVTIIHNAWLRAEEMEYVDYRYIDNIGYSGDMEIVLREVAEEEAPDIITGDAFGNEELVRRVASDYPEIAFVFGSGEGPQDPNMSVFDNWIYEPAYLAGLVAGSLTETNIIGIVAGYPVPEVNRIVNAFRIGVYEVNPQAEVLVSYIDSWHNPSMAKEAALAQIDVGADILVAEIVGVIEAAEENDILVIGSKSDLNQLAPDIVVTSIVWDMSPTVNYVIGRVAGGEFYAEDLKEYSMMQSGGALLAPFYGFEEIIPDEVLSLIAQREHEIVTGQYIVPELSDVPEDVDISSIFSD